MAQNCDPNQLPRPANNQKNFPRPPTDRISHAGLPTARILKNVTTLRNCQARAITESNRRNIATTGTRLLKP